MTKVRLPLEHDPDLTEVFVDHLEVQAQLGVYSHERGRTQPLIVSVRVWARINPIKDDLVETLDYNVFADAAQSLGRDHHYDLVESYIGALADLIMQDGRIEGAWISAGKPEAIENARAAGSAVFRRR